MKEENMTENEKENAYPVKTIHDFVSEINSEWGKLKTGAIFSIVTSSILLVAFVFVFIYTARNGFEVSDMILELLLAGFLIYTIYLMNGQYRFFRKWEKRMTRMFTLEEKLMKEKPEEP